ncbi:MAG: hypothetical protein AB8I08_01125 [Sandaracinaceae bacterium]
MLRHVPRASLPLLAFVLLCGFQCDSEVPIGQTDGSAGDGGSGLACMGESPAGCTVDSECASGEMCITGFASSRCDCDEESGEWACTRDLGGGFCAADMCPDPAADGVSYSGPGPECPPIGCGPGTTTSPIACGRGCMPEASCTEPNPAGCTSDTQCGANEQCVTGTRSSSCTCDAASDSWGCTDDLGGGDCLPDTCPDPSDEGVEYISTSAEDCADIDFSCDAGDVAIPSECGCGCMRPPAPDCGTLSCNYATEYCEELIPGVSPADPTYTCRALPDDCDTTPTCASCFPDDGPGFCSERPEGLRFSIALP